MGRQVCLTVPLVFVMLKSPPVMGFYYTPFKMMWLGAGVLVHGSRLGIKPHEPVICLGDSQKLWSAHY